MKKCSFNVSLSISQPLSQLKIIHSNALYGVQRTIEGSRNENGCFSEERSEESIRRNTNQTRRCTHSVKGSESLKTESALWWFMFVVCEYSNDAVANQVLFARRLLSCTVRRSFHSFAFIRSWKASKLIVQLLWGYHGPSPYNNSCIELRNDHSPETLHQN